MRIAAVGEICQDLYLPDAIVRPGGIASNFAFHAARAGAGAVLFGALGDDDAGLALESWLAETPVDTGCVVRRPGASTRQRLRVVGGERDFCGFDPGVALDHVLDAGALERLGRCDAIACSDGLGRLTRECLGEGPRLVMDFSQDTEGNEPGRPDAWIRPWLGSLSVAFVGGTLAFRAALEALARETDVLIVLTAGPAGAFAWQGERAWTQASVADEVVDTNGCGDAFAAAFTVAWLQGADVPLALGCGARAAAWVAARWGAQPRA